MHYTAVVLLGSAATLCSPGLTTLVKITKYFAPFNDAYNASVTQGLITPYSLQLCCTTIVSLILSLEEFLK